MIRKDSPPGFLEGEGEEENFGILRLKISLVFEEKSKKPGGESFRIIPIHSKPLHPLSFPWKRASSWREEDWEYKMSPSILIRCRQCQCVQTNLQKMGFCSFLSPDQSLGSLQSPNPQVSLPSPFQKSGKKNPSGSTPPIRSLSILFDLHGNEHQDGERRRGRLGSVKFRTINSDPMSSIPMCANNPAEMGFCSFLSPDQSLGLS
ncbi:hypothetical protein CDAR_189991 [Caerostris darwini]|uniref:Uncharacterized protein n=1 Tax=Caerostris darwini TaxID=1538125 RepID=A0AAV4QRV8_9ARAC|nr:hypothetical protein CDAR_189991 [Caerostris darwini]